ncbi:tRNA uridine-5-carboxymethylaminomethyl(34) synthesis GTPase MnmE [Kordiimonas aquimaris]|uniref:tRNA uridine-5-carboxymethylaminomethyl(34) synthesis GTPase MnmE n=1 Tax=Kordiimonas aquimaris TaxID=707591 RepID=UPI0021CF1B6C|nr:tRNA uridine-5-carboxymethylaminomethyl(34) synthesis GTPase MnmE [Kordiimonas aquimaris]
MEIIDTIFALSSGAGTSGVAVVRLSGPQSIEALLKLSSGSVPAARYASLRKLKDPKSGETLDQALVVVFPAPASFTGEDVVELHLHGGRAVVDGVLSVLAVMDGVRPAEAGEFSRRAFENGKLDLTEAEGLNDLIHAQTAAQRSLALKQMDGALRTLYEDWRSRLLSHLAHLEADIDFPDEDLPEGVAGLVLPQILSLRSDITQHIVDSERGRLVHDGFRIVIIGEPNVGKSTLLNAIARTDVAIVSDEAGTTRDAIEIQLDLGGFPVRIIDTAGLRSTDSAVEKEGIRRAEEKAADAGLRLLLVPVDEWPHIPSGLSRWVDENTIIIVTQVDRAEYDAMFHVEHSERLHEHDPVFVSAKTGDGIDGLFERLKRIVQDKMAPQEMPTLTRIRHQQALEVAIDHLVRFEGNAGMDAVLAAEDVRMAVRAIGGITGRVGVEDMLDIVFSDFCIGK